MKESMIWIKVSALFQIACFVAAMGLLIWCFYEYSKNEDVVEVSFKKYGEDSQSIYPDITLCFNNPFYDEELKKHDVNWNSQKYSLFLTGEQSWYWDDGMPVEYWDERVLEVSYENVSLQLKKHIIGNGMVFPSKTGLSSNSNISIEQIFSFSIFAIKCFTFPLPNGIGITKFVVVIENSVFPSGVRPKSGFELLFHYPQEKYRSGQFRMRNWPTRTNMSSKAYQLDVNVKDVEVLRRRDKYKKPCVDIESFDNVTSKHIFEKIGCFPPYSNLQMDVEIPPCTTKEELKSISKLLIDAYTLSGQYENATPPCNELQKIGVDFVETDFDIEKIFTGSDVDVNLDYNTIMEAWEKNG